MSPKRAFFILALLLPWQALGNAGSFTYEGYLTDASDAPVTGTVPVIFQIYGVRSGVECQLYSESRNVAVADGHFAARVGGPAASSSTVYLGSGGFSQIFAAKAMTGESGCSFDPTQAGAERVLKVTVNGEPMGSTTLSAAPMAMVATQVGAHTAGSLLRVENGGAPVTVPALQNGEYNTLMDLIAGTSASYLNSASSISGANLQDGTVSDTKIANNISASKINGDISGKAGGFTGALAGDVTGTQSATVVSKLQGRAVDSSAPTNGQALVWSAVNSRWEPGTVSGGGSADWSSLTGKPSSFPSDWSTLANIPANFTPAAHSHVVNEITSASGKYFTYKPNNGACANGEVLKWSTTSSGWICGTDVSATGGGDGVASIAATAPLTLDDSDAENPRLGVSTASTVELGVVQLATSSDVSAGLVVQANDTRLTNSRAPTGAAGGELTGNYPNPTVAASTTATSNSLVRRNATGDIAGAAADFGSLILNNGGGSTISVQTPVAFTSYVLKLPSSRGTSGQVLTSNGTDMVWTNGSAITAGNVSGTVAVANGGTGATTAASARTNLGITTTGDSIVTAANAASARAAIGALSDSDSRLAPTPAAGNVLNYVRVNAGGTAYEARTAASVLSDIGAMANITAGANGNVLTSNGTTWSSTALPFATSSAKGLMQVGTGLAVSSGTVSADFGTVAGKIAQGNDSRFPSSICASGNKMRWDGSVWQCETDVVGGGSSQWAGTTNISFTAGDVGIGTTIPAAKLHVATNANGESGLLLSNSSGGTGAEIGVKVQGNGSHWGWFGTRGTGYTAAWGAADANDTMIYGSDDVTMATNGGVSAIKFATGGSADERMRITSSGNVGIGTTNPSMKFEVNGAARFAGQTTALGYAAAAGGSASGVVNGLFSPASNTLGLASGSVERVRLDSNGNVGIGTSAPKVVLDVVSSAEVSERGFTSRQISPTDNYGARVNIARARGSPGSPVAVVGDDNLGMIAAYGYNGTDYGTYSAGIKFDAVGNYTSGSAGSRIGFIVTPQGTTSGSVKALLDSGGLSVSGQVTGAAATTNLGSIDWNQGNVITLSADCSGSPSFANLRSGGSYTLIVTGSGISVCNFSTVTTGADAGTVSYRFNPPNAARIASSHTIYSLTRAGSIVYVSWISGF